MAVLITRPDERGTLLAEMLNKAGVATILLPFFSIAAGRELNDLPNKINQLKPDDYIVVVSKSVVPYADETLLNTGFRWRSDVHYFAVGQSTAEFFSARTEQAVCYPYRQENSEGLLSLPAMRHLEGKTILLLRGNNGRNLFPEQAKLRGATVETVECYQRLPIDYDNEEQTSICKRAGIRTIIVTSAEILTALIDFIPKNEHNWLKACQLITVSRRIADLARQFGWENVVIAARADNNALLQAVLNQTQ